MSPSSPLEQVCRITTRSRERAKAATTTSCKGGAMEEEDDGDRTYLAVKKVDNLSF